MEIYVTDHFDLSMFRHMPEDMHLEIRRITEEQFVQFLEEEDGYTHAF